MNLHYVSTSPGPGPSVYLQEGRGALIGGELVTPTFMMSNLLEESLKFAQWLIFS